MILGNMVGFHTAEGFKIGFVGLNDAEHTTYRTETTTKTIRGTRDGHVLVSIETVIEETDHRPDDWDLL
jgi:hypothetical protein